MIRADLRVASLICDIIACMQANLYATFRLLANTRSIQLDLPSGTPLDQAITAIVDQLPVLRPHWLDECGELRAHVHVFVNGSDISTLPAGLRTPLQPGDVLDFFPPVAGG